MVQHVPPQAPRERRQLDVTPAGSPESASSSAPRRNRNASTRSSHSTITTPAPDAMVPSRRQYLDLKAQHPDAILLYRMGDFYETFDDDAVTAAQATGITLTSRNFGRNGRVPMAGVPYHALNQYLGHLLRRGLTVAIAEQVGEVGKGLVERAVTRVISPGTIAERDLLPDGENRYLAALSVCPRGGDGYGLAWVDVSTGEFAMLDLTGPDTTGRLADELARLNPAELLLPRESVHLNGALPADTHLTHLERRCFSTLDTRMTGSPWWEWGERASPLTPDTSGTLASGAARAIMSYLERTNPALLPLLTNPRSETPNQRVGLDAATRRNLELTRSNRTGGTRGSLLGVLDVTQTPMGARALRRMVNEPLRDLVEITRRREIVRGLVGQPLPRQTLASALAGLGDLERLIGRVTRGGASPREFLNLLTALGAVGTLRDLLSASKDLALTTVAPVLATPADLVESLTAGVWETPEGQAAVRPGFCRELDGAVSGAHDTRSWLIGLERHERDRTGIRSLKVAHNKVFGYYIEITRPNLHLAPLDYTRKQTIANGERFVSAPLKDAEARLLAADTEIATLERRALERLTATIQDHVSQILIVAARLAEVDALLALATVAVRDGWVAPTVDASDCLEITGGRHPVVETELAGESFIPNDCRLDGPSGIRQIVLTGPNMGGKSTYLRQIALITLLAQIGSYVPAQSAHIGLADRIFTRVGAQDDLAGGASTFMVEMLETATILHQATRQSLVILDEVGRGTSTGDGLAIARAVLEDLHDRVQARALFATHYLELARFAEALPHAKNTHVAIIDRDGAVIFLHAVRPGPADRSYGIQVARLAGLPAWVADRADALLAADQAATYDDGEFVSQPAESTPRAIAESTANDGAPYQLTLMGLAGSTPSGDQLVRSLRELDLATLSPKAALDWLFEQRSRLR